MTDIRIAYIDDSGNCCIVFPTDEALEAIGLKAVIQRSVPVGKAHIVTSKDELPQSRANRDTWTIRDGKVVEA